MDLLRRYWRPLILVAVWLLATTAGFWVFEPEGLLSRNPQTARFAKIFLTALLGLTILPMRRACERRHIRLWGTIAAVALGVGVIAFFSFQALRSSRTLIHDGTVYYIGTEMTEAAADFLKNEPTTRHEDLLANAAFEETEVWTKASIDRSRFVLSMLYFLSVPLLSFGLMAAAQLGCCMLSSGAMARVPAQSIGEAAPEGVRKIFMSYCRSDGEFCIRLAQDLKRAGLEVWIDQIDIQPGAQWDSEVEAALRRADTVLVVLSQDSVASRNVLDEASFAIDEGDVVVPILYRPCEIPLRLRRLQRIDFTGEYGPGLEQLVTRLGAAGGATAGADYEEESLSS